jgi:hypothetical protein
VRTLQGLLKKSVEEKATMETEVKTNKTKIANLQSELLVLQSASIKKNLQHKTSPVSPDLISVTEETKRNSYTKQMQAVVNEKVTKKYESYAKGQMSVIDVSALRANLNCRSCSQTFISPVILLCSHTYCRACIEKQWAKYRCYGVCVTCNDPRDKKHRCSADIGRHRRIYLSTETLDNIIWLFLETLTERERLQYEAREKSHFEILKELGVDTDSSPAATLSKLVSLSSAIDYAGNKTRDYDDEEEEEEEVGEKKMDRDDNNVDNVDDDEVMEF